MRQTSQACSASSGEILKENMAIQKVEILIKEPGF